MKLKSYLILLFGGFLFFLEVEVSHGSDIHPEEAREDSSPLNDSSMGPDKAILDASRNQGFKLSEASLRRLNIQTKTLGFPDFLSIPPSALVYYQDRIGIYRLRNGWFRLVPVTIVQQFPTAVRVKSEELRQGDGLVTQGIGFLRVADMAIFGEAAGGHVH